MIDSKTESLWSHILGEAMRGPMIGTKLETIPSVMTEWSDWKVSHPDTTVVLMPRATSAYSRGFHNPDSGLLIGLLTSTGSKSWQFPTLYRSSPVNDTVDGIPVVVSLKRETFTATIFDRRTGGRELTFRSRGDDIIDLETESTWDLLSGLAVSGSLQGERLQLLPGIVSDSAVWSLYFESENSKR